MFLLFSKISNRDHESIDFQPKVRKETSEPVREASEEKSGGDCIDDVKSKIVQANEGRLKSMNFCGLNKFACVSTINAVRKIIITVGPQSSSARTTKDRCDFKFC